VRNGAATIGAHRWPQRLHGRIGRITHRILFEPFSDSAGYYGLMRQPELEMRAWVGAADSAGLQIAVHAIGDRANAIILAIYDSVTTRTARATGASRRARAASAAAGRSAVRSPAGGGIDAALSRHR